MLRAFDWESGQRLRGPARSGALAATLSGLYPASSGSKRDDSIVFVCGLSHVAWWPAFIRCIRVGRITWRAARASPQARALDHERFG
jgi:hypothetical protein